MKTCPVCDKPYPDDHTSCPADGAVLIEICELTPGSLVRGKYKILRKLGRGGMGVVYLAEHQMLGGKMALKFLSPALSRDPQFVKRFRNEARAAYQLRHPNIVEVADLDQDEDGSLFIAMEFVDGTNLRVLLQETVGGLPVEQALSIAREVAAGLAAAHERGAVHRDIKPDNILLGMDRQGREQAKILDFGIATMAEGVTYLSRTDGLLLTPPYAAPEQWIRPSGSELDGRADLYALGVVLFEMLTGRTPFKAHDPQGWMYQHLEGAPASLLELRPELEQDYPGLNAIVMKLLARRREDRFASANELLGVLDLFAQAASIPSAFVVNSKEFSREQRETMTPETKRNALDDAASSEAPSKVSSKEARRARTAGWWQYWWFGLAGIAVVLLTVMALRMRREIPSKTRAEMPAFTPKPGKYTEPQMITIEDATASAKIHYTLDGSPPTESSPVYHGPLRGLPSGVVVRAMAVAEGRVASADIAGVYLWDVPFDRGKKLYDEMKYAEARPLFEKACDAGESRGCDYLGYMYATGLGGAKDRGKAKEIFQTGCDKGNLSSCASLGSLYQNTGNLVEARRYFEKACDQGKGSALGCQFLHGIE